MPEEKRICVLGLGYIGLPTASIFATHGYEVIGCDINLRVVETVNRGNLPIEEPGLATIVKAAVKSGNLRAKSYPEEADIFVIAVPTPVTHDKKADLCYIEGAAESIIPYLRKDNLVILESTSPPGTTRDFLAPILEKSGMVAGKDFHLAHCPERVLPGHILKELIENDRVIGGLSRESAEAARELYAAFVEGTIHLTDATTAEMVKIMENTYRDVNIALANELAVICEKMGISAWEVIRLANLHPRVNLHLPGPGVGGHCLAVDPWFVVEKFPEEARIIGLSRQTNDTMPLAVVKKLQAILQEMTNPRVTILGVSYKGNIDDARETPALGICQGLEHAMIDFSIYDPHVKEFPFELQSLTEAFKDSDCLVLVTDHDEFKFMHPQQAGKLMRHRILLDTRNCLDLELWNSYGFSVFLLGEGWRTIKLNLGEI